VVGKAGTYSCEATELKLNAVLIRPRGIFANEVLKSVR